MYKAILRSTYEETEKKRGFYKSCFSKIGRFTWENEKMGSSEYNCVRYFYHVCTLIQLINDYNSFFQMNTRSLPLSIHLLRTERLQVYNRTTRNKEHSLSSWKERKRKVTKWVNIGSQFRHRIWSWETASQFLDGRVNAAEMLEKGVFNVRQTR